MKVLSSLKSAKNRPGYKIIRRHGDVFNKLFIKLFKIYYYLKIKYSRTVIKRDKSIGAKSFYPSLNSDIVMKKSLIIR